MPTRSTIDKFNALMPQIAALLFECCERLNERTSPLPPLSIALINTVLEQARVVLSRETSAGFVRPLPLAQQATPGDAFVALLQASTALTGFATRHGMPLSESEHEADEDEFLDLGRF